MAENKKCKKAAAKAMKVNREVTMVAEKVSRGVAATKTEKVS